MRRSDRVAGTVVTSLVAAVALSACSLLAPSAEALSGAYAGESGDAATGAQDAGASCPVGTKLCSGACVSTASPATGCAAASCEPCRAAHAAAICVAGACALGPCENGWANCNERPDDGCEIDTRSSARFCGSCLVSCGEKTPRCEQGECAPRCHAVKLAQVAAHIAFPTTGMSFGTGDFTVELWIAKHIDFALADNRSLFTTNEALQASAISLFETGAGRLSCSVSEPVPNSSPTLVGPLPEDRAWHHVACVRRSGLVELYIDGVLRAQQENTNSVVPNATGAIGKPSGYPDYKAGPFLVGPVRISRVARYAASFTPRAFWSVDADTILQYLSRRDFDGASVPDETGSDNDGNADVGVVFSRDTPCP